MFTVHDADDRDEKPRSVVSNRQAVDGGKTQSFSHHHSSSKKLGSPLVSVEKEPFQTATHGEHQLPLFTDSPDSLSPSSLESISVPKQPIAGFTADWSD